MTYVHDHITEHISKMRGYARALTRNKETAEDILQDACYRALKGAHSFEARGKDSLLAWCLCIVHNCHVDQCQKWNREPETLDLALCDHVVPDMQELHLWVEDVGQMLEKLTPEMRRAIRLIVLEDKKYEEAAEVAAVPVGTIRSQFSRARAEMRYMRDR